AYDLAIPTWGRSRVVKYLSDVSLFEVRDSCPVDGNEFSPPPIPIPRLGTNLGGALASHHRTSTVQPASRSSLAAARPRSRVTLAMTVEGMPIPWSTPEKPFKYD